MTAIIIARFQVPRLHLGHIYLITTALYECDSVVIFLGSPDVKDDRNPYGIDHRKEIIQKIFPQIDTYILPPDRPGDDQAWSNDVDDLIDGLYIEYPILYHSRDSFKDFYKGRYSTKEIPELPGYSGTEVRKNENNE